ncbi:hypothetical protein [Hymenobacter sp. YC55]|uniref:hypothetical protein n=1 Tax=Hymenobacter sp. YC55 TaxID=3034019 RepID=UPI0023F6955C|nr:hypothetical protein [Hymenobacter sp. YC55]MDF7812824.1 hypothetical protein [Hymenobacter sp. YC55]
MDTNTLASKVAAATRAGNRNLSAYPKWMAVVNVWNAMLRGARKYGEQEGFVTIHSMSHTVGVTCACRTCAVV